MIYVFYVNVNVECLHEGSRTRRELEQGTRTSFFWLDVSFFLPCLLVSLRLFLLVHRDFSQSPLSFFLLFLFLTPLTPLSSQSYSVFNSLSF